LHEREEAAERARMEAEVVARAQGVATEAPAESLHFDDLAQKLTARVHAERRAREEAGRKGHATPERTWAAAANPAAANPVAGNPADGFPALEFVSSKNGASTARTTESAPATDAALPAIDVGSSAGRGDIRHVTPGHVPSALERAMMEREARAESEAKADGAATPPTVVTAAAAGAGHAPTSRASATTGRRSAPPTFETNRKLAATAPAAAADADNGAPQKTDPTLEADRDEPLHERLNVDRTAHDILVESADERRKTEAAALSRQAADMRRQRKDEEARRVAFAQREKRRRGVGRALFAAAVGVALLAIAWLQFVPLDSHRAEAQQALSARLNQPTTISTVRYVLLPSPRIVLEGVRIGAAHAVHVDRVDARAWPAQFISGPLELSTVDASGVTIDPGMLATIPAWTGGRNANTVHVSKLRLSDVKLGGADAKSEAMNGEIDFAANGTVSAAAFHNDTVQLEIVPQKSGVGVVLNARNWRVPFGPAVTFSYLTVEGIVDKARFGTTRLEGRIGGGEVTGTLAARWDGPTLVGGELKVQGTRIEQAAQQLAPNLRVKGVLSAHVRYAMQADSASGLMEKAMVEGTFALTRGEVGDIDLARAVQSPGTPTRGRTTFDELKGSVQITGNQYSYRNLQLTSGPLEATGFVDVSPSGQLNGRIDAQVTARSAVMARSVFALRGTVKEPQLVR
jgi:hypothetical protein